LSPGMGRVTLGDMPPSEPRQPKKSTSYRLSTEGLRLLGMIAEHFGVTQSAVLELLIREKAQSLGFWQSNNPTGLWPPPQSR
jgi:hypothetical protein